MSARTFDHALVRAHVEMLHELAADLEGELVVCVFGEDPTRINPKTGRMGLAIHRSVLRFRIGDIEANVDAIVKYEGVEHANVYMPLHVVRRGLLGNARGTKDDIVAVLGLVADRDSDTGKAGEFPFEPSFEIETSPGNFQPAIIFDRPLERKEAEPLAKALQKATGGDFGTGDIAHVWRVPGTLNWPNARKLERGRSPDPAPVRLSRPWCGAILSIDVIRATLSDWTKSEESGATESMIDGESDDPKAILAKLPPKTRFDLQAIPPPDIDRSPHCMRVLKSMMHAGLTDYEIEIVTAEYAEGLFARYHDEGKDLRAEIRRVREKMKKEAAQESNSGRSEDGYGRNHNGPTIRIEAGAIEVIVDAAEQALISADRGLYLHGNRIVFVDNVRLITAEGKRVLSQQIREREEHALLEDLASSATFEKFDARKGRYARCDPPMQIVTTLQQRRGRLRFPVLRGVINAPTLRADGTILKKAGYDQESGLLFDPRGVEFPSLIDRPTQADAESALAVLRWPIKDFPFVNNTDQAVALSAILTACVRRSLPTAPLHGFSSPVAGTGKSILVDIACVIVNGRAAGVLAQGRRNGESEKRLGSLLLSGEGVIAIDNCEDPVGGELLCQLLTQEQVTIRILGKSEAPEVPSNAFVTATGNNLTFEGDLTRRALLCRLDPNEERPELREFEFDPVALAKSKRPQLVVAALTILRAYQVAGRPSVGLTPLGSFETWSSWVRGALVWLGVGDPVDSMESVRARDPQTEALRAVLTPWRALVGDDLMTTAELIDRAKASRGFSGVRLVKSSQDKDRVDGALFDAFLVVAGQGSEVNSKRLGKWLGQNRDRMLDGLRIVHAGERQGSALWRVEDVHRAGPQGEAAWLW